MSNESCNHGNLSRFGLSTAHQSNASGWRNKGGIKSLQFVFVRLSLVALLFFAESGGRSSFAEADQRSLKIASEYLNEFDLARYCAQAGGDLGSRPIPRRKFGYTTSPTEQAPAFAYVTSEYYAQLSRFGDPQECQFKSYLYRLGKNGRFTQEEIDEKKFAQLANNIRAYERSYEQSNPGKRLGVPIAARLDSIGGCLFPIYWYTFGGREHALISLANRAAFTNYVIPPGYREMDGSPSACNAWGERHLTNSAIASGGLGFLEISPETFFVELEEYKRGFIFRAGSDFQCTKATDAFSLHVLISREAFDADVRPRLEGVLKKYNYQSKMVTSYDGQTKVLPFSDSVFLNQEFATFIDNLAKEKGCE
jgi:hypothetical protein